MKKLLLLTAFILFQQMYSQVFVEDVNINELNIKYIELVGVNTSLFGVKIKVYVDYGQKIKFMKSYKIRDSKGKIMKFHTMIDALNFMYSNGWKFVNYSQAVLGGKIRYVYLLEKDPNFVGSTNNYNPVPETEHHNTKKKNKTKKNKTKKNKTKKKKTKKKKTKKKKTKKKKTEDDIEW